MSVKDTRFKRQCPICTDTLPGTDDAKGVYDDLKQTVEDIDAGKATAADLGCGLCGEDVSLEEARKIVAAGEPVLQKAKPGEFDE